MRKPEFVTFTGLDDRTDLDAAIALSEKYPIEWGVLFSPSQQGRSSRYPSIGTLASIQDAGRSLRVSAHLCGEHSRRIMGGAVPELPAVLTGVYQRAQVNHVYAKPTRIATFSAMARISCVGQFTIGPFPSNESIQWLYDPSGGMGRPPAVWPRHPGGDRLVGFAGGIGPESAKVVVERINSSGPYWIDMESRVRTDDDWLDLDKCRRVCVAIYG